MERVSADHVQLHSPDMTYRSGEQAPYTGMFLFVSYVKAKPETAEPEKLEKSIYLLQGYTFPTVRSTRQAAFWRPM